MERVLEELIKFRDERNWKQYHKPKDLAISLSLEANEFLELFQWKSSEEAVEKNFEEMKDELADVFSYAFILAHELHIDIEKAILDKIEKNKVKYPIEKAYGVNSKYTELS
jgi:NTP pyrophosphatase (non-canonical NTP hydrolase)